MVQQTPEQLQAAYAAAGLPLPTQQPATQTITPETQIQTPAAPAPTVLTPEQQAQYFASQGSSATPLSPQQWLAQQTQGTAPAQSQPSSTTQPVTAGALTIPATGSVVDLLNMAGVDSSQTNRKSLADQFGVQNYDFSAAKNKELADKFLAAYNANKGLPTPESGAEARTALSEFMDSQIPVQDSQEMFFDAYSSLSPIEKTLYDSISQLLSPTTDRKLISDIYAEESAKSGIEPLQQDLAQTIADIRLTEDQVRDELSGGGVVLESQVRGLVAVRTKALLTKAEQLSNIIDSKQDYVDNIVRLTQADREEVDKQVDRKLGLSQVLLDMTYKMQDRARDNYEYLVEQSGGLGNVAELYSDNPYMLSQIERGLSLPQGTLSNPIAISMFETTTEWSDPYILGNNYVQENFGTGEIRTVGSAGLPGGGKPVSSSTALQIADSQSALKMLGNLETLINDNENLFGPFIGTLGANNPYSLEAQTAQATINATKQIVGKYLEGGVLRKEDEAKYERILPKLSDRPEVAKKKLEAVRALVNSSIESQQETLQAAGYNPAIVSDSNVVIGPDGQEYQIIQ